MGRNCLGSSRASRAPRVPRRRNVSAAGGLVEHAVAQRAGHAALEVADIEVDDLEAEGDHEEGDEPGPEAGPEPRNRGRGWKHGRRVSAVPRARGLLTMAGAAE